MRRLCARLHYDLPREASPLLPALLTRLPACGTLLAAARNGGSAPERPAGCCRRRRAAARRPRRAAARGATHHGGPWRGRVLRRRARLLHGPQERAVQALLADRAPRARGHAQPGAPPAAPAAARRCCSAARAHLLPPPRCRLLPHAPHRALRHCSQPSHRRSLRPALLPLPPPIATQPWGPTGTELAMLAQLTHSPQDCATVLAVVDFRLGYPPKKWRNVYKVGGLGQEWCGVWRGGRRGAWAGVCGGMCVRCGGRGWQDAFRTAESAAAAAAALASLPLTPLAACLAR